MAWFCKVCFAMRQSIYTHGKAADTLPYVECDSQSWLLLLDDPLRRSPLIQFPSSTQQRRLQSESGRDDSHHTVSVGAEHWRALHLGPQLRKPDHQYQLNQLNQLEQPFAVAMQEAEIPYTSEPF